MKTFLKSAPASILGYALLILVLTAGTAQSLSGTNTVFSDDIVNGQVGYADIRDGAVGGRKLLDDSVTGTDVNEATLRLPGAIRTTAVSSAGAKVLGTGTASRLVEGQYRVDYGFNVTGCLAHATAGGGAAVDNLRFDAHASTWVAFFSTTTVDVFVRSGPTSVNSAFFVTLICP